MTMLSKPEINSKSCLINFVGKRKSLITAINVKFKISTATMIPLFQSFRNRSKKINKAFVCKEKS